MKPAEFDYICARTLDEVCQHLADEDADCRIIAGGQTLVPLMAMRFARPARLIDINRVDGLRGIAASDGGVEIGAMTRQREAERDPAVAARLPLLAKALPHVGHFQTRNRGTVGGSIVHGDPSAEIPLVALLLDAAVELRGAKGARTVAIRDFFDGPMMTNIAPDECLTTVRFPIWTGGLSTGSAFHEIAPRHGDFAIASAAAQIALDGDGVCVRAALGVGGCGSTPIRLGDAEDALVGHAPTAGAIDAAIATVDAAIDPEDTTQASAAYRRRAAPELVRRAIADAVAEARS